MRFTKPILIIFSIFILYVIYSLFFAESKEIFDLSRLSPDDNKNVDVRVYLAKDKPIQLIAEQNISIFYVKDKNNKIYKVQGPANLPEGFHDAEVVVIRGHMHHDYFHASSIIKLE